MCQRMASRRPCSPLKWCPMVLTVWMDFKAIVLYEVNRQRECWGHLANTHCPNHLIKEVKRMAQTEIGTEKWVGTECTQAGKQQLRCAVGWNAHIGNIHCFVCFYIPEDLLLCLLVFKVIPFDQISKATTFFMCVSPSQTTNYQLSKWFQSSDGCWNSCISTSLYLGKECVWAVGISCFLFLSYLVIQGVGVCVCVSSWMLSLHPFSILG